ncbi:cytochrome P450 3A5-like [Pecten maximus]|uniref:cytochrome P450 3A5-like n=1 Tax=Pecten maximus TaxID=6579 RepID=UPI001457F7FB|nr:cytochrome P450 3A5-like [Pecten maximus]
MELIGVDVPVWAILILIVCVCYTVLMSRDFLTFRRMGIPGPTPLPIFGNLISLMNQGIRAFDQAGIRKYGKVFGHYDMVASNLVVADKEMLKEILVKQFNNFPDRMTIDDFNGDMEGSLLNTKGDHWKHDRSVITPTFSSGKLRKMVPLVQEACDTLVKTCRDAIKRGDGGQVEMRRLFGGFTMDVISSTAFGIHVDSQGNPNDLFVTHAKKMFDISLASPAVLMIILFPSFKPLFRKMGASIFPKDSMAYFRKITTQLYEERRQSKAEGRTDFLQLMVDAQDGRHDIDESNGSAHQEESSRKGINFDGILANAEIFFAAGYETTSITLTMTSYNLALNPECQEKLRREIEEEIGSELIDYENVQKLQYLDMCINETLRMYPPALRFDRMCVKTTKVKDITIPAGMVVTIPAYALQNDPEVWEKPDVFNPERFNPTEKAKHDPMDYIPFGHGPRSCIGMRLALLETKMAAANAIRNFRFCVGSKTDGIRVFDQDGIRNYGRVFGHYDMVASNLVVADKEMLKEILVKQFNNFPDRMTFEDFNGDMERSLLNTKGDHWKHDRGVITPTFSSGKLRKMMPLVQEACGTLVKTCRNSMINGDGGQVEIRRREKNVVPLFRKLGTSIFPKDSMAYFRKITTQLLEERRQSKGEGRTDFLQLMVDAQEGTRDIDETNRSAHQKEPSPKGITFDAILANAEVFFAAGYETTSITLTMTAYNLALNPECQEKLRREIEEEIGSELIDYENVKKLEYLDMCISETLRMYPPALRFDRMCVKTTKVKDITIPAGMVVTIPVYALHNDPEIWEKPDVFNPERFNPTEKAKHDPLDYVPFGHGPRSCIGMRLALLETKMAAANAIRNFRFCVGRKTEIPPKMEDMSILKPKYLWLKLEEIKRQ